MLKQPQPKKVFNDRSSRPGELSRQDVAAIIENELAVSHYQPIVGMTSRSIIGFESLCRARHPATGEPIPPPVLFDAASRYGLLVELDRLCRRKALMGFAAVSCKLPEAMLTINFETSLLDLGVAGSGNILNMVDEYNLDPATIVIELVESKVTDTEALAAFVAFYRKHGFSLALDDVGAGHSNLERIALLQPDVIKIDRSLISGVERHFYKQEIIRALAGLGHHIGSLVLAEGVETQEEALTALDLGADLLQGYLLGMPRPDGGAATGWCVAEINALGEKMVDQALANAARNEQWGQHLEGIFSWLREQVNQADINNLGSMLMRMIEQQPRLECVYVLDNDGRQISETVCAPNKISYRGQVLYRPAPKGADMSLKRYYLMLKAGLKRYASSPYISLASGNQCVTLSLWFDTADGRRMILCADFDAESFVGRRNTD